MTANSAKCALYLPGHVASCRSASCPGMLGNSRQGMAIGMRAAHASSTCVQHMRLACVNQRPATQRGVTISTPLDCLVHEHMYRISRFQTIVLNHCGNRARATVLLHYSTVAQLFTAFIYYQPVALKNFGILRSIAGWSSYRIQYRPNLTSVGLYRNGGSIRNRHHRAMPTTPRAGRAGHKTCSTVYSAVVRT